MVAQLDPRDSIESFVGTTGGPDAAPIMHTLGKYGEAATVLPPNTDPTALVIDGLRRIYADGVDAVSEFVLLAKTTARPHSPWVPGLEAHEDPTIVDAVIGIYVNADGVEVWLALRNVDDHGNSTYSDPVLSGTSIPALI